MEKYFLKNGSIYGISQNKNSESVLSIEVEAGQWTKMISETSNFLGLKPSYRVINDYAALIELKEKSDEELVNEEVFLGDLEKEIIEEKNQTPEISPGDNLDTPLLDEIKQEQQTEIVTLGLLQKLRGGNYKLDPVDSGSLLVLQNAPMGYDNGRKWIGKK